MTRNITVGIDVGTRFTRVVISEYTKKSKRPSVIGVGIAPSLGLRHGYIVNHKDAVRSIKQAVHGAERSANIRIKSALISIGGISLESLVAKASVVITRADGEITTLDVEKAIDLCREQVQNRANKRILDTIPLKYKIDGKEVPGRPQGMKGSKLEVKTLFVTCLEQHVEDLVQAVEDAGVEVEDVVASPVAASLVALTKRQRTVGCLLANIGAETVTIAVFEDDMLVSLKVFPIGSTDITNDIALGLQVPLDEAEEIKLTHDTGLYSKRKLEEIIEARLTDIFELIESHLKKIKRAGLLPGGIILTGGGAGISTIEDFAKASLKLPSKIASPEILNNHTGKIKDSSWFVAFGLCIYGFQQAKQHKPTQVFKTAKERVVEWIRQFYP